MELSVIGQCCHLVKLVITDNVVPSGIALIADGDLHVGSAPHKNPPACPRVGLGLCLVLSSVRVVGQGSGNCIFVELQNFPGVVDVFYLTLNICEILSFTPIKCLFI